MDNLGIENKGYASDPDEDSIKKIAKISQKNENESNSLMEDTGKMVENVNINTEEAADDNSVPEEEPQENIPPVGYFSLFRYANCCDMLMVVIAAVIAIASGTFMPAIQIIYGKLVDKLIGFDASRNTTSPTIPNSTVTREEFLSATADLCLWYSAFGVGFFVCNYMVVTFFSIAAANQAFRIRCRFMQAILRQDITWHDTHQTGDFATRITGDLERIQEGIGEKVGMCLNFVSNTLIAVVSGMYFGWKLALVILCVTPILTLSIAVVSKIQATFSNQELEAYGTAGAVAEEVFSSIRTVVAFGGQKKEIERFEACLETASKKGIKRGLLTSIGSAVFWFCIFGGYSLAFWYGVKLIIESRGQSQPEYTAGKVITIFFNVMSGSMFFGQTAPYFETFASAKGAAAKIFSIIDREPDIDSSSNIGFQPESLEGHIRLTDVHFNYPSRPTVPVLRGVDFEVNPGETVALVGSSGCGKSTVVQLLLRFYDIDSGSIELDGIDVKELHLGWLRDHIGLVGQEPVLFSTTIEENIRMGRQHATTEDIVAAAVTANAHDFIMGLPKKYQTCVGERGTQLSGGQKQRIAIARALVRNPRILLLDEATSALDTESEAVVQSALDQARRGRTTLVVAHRLSTIRTADKIVVLDEGVVQEAGTHEDLMQSKGLYYQLVTAQTKDEVPTDENEEEDEEEEEEELPPGSADLKRQNSIISEKSVESVEEMPKGSKIDRQISTVSRQMSNISQKMIEDEDDESTSSLQKSRLLKLSAPEWPYALIGCISAIIMGVHFPAFGIVFGSIIGLLSKSTEIIEEKYTFFCLIYLGMAITSCISNFLQIFMLTIAGEKFTFRLRKMVFSNIITQDISFFDNSNNSVGSLCSRLNSDASNVQGATGSRISSTVQALSTMAFAVFIAVYYNWKIGLVTFAFVPLLLLSAALESRVVRGHANKEIKGMEKASKIATEAIENIRTVASLHQEETIYNQYRSTLLDPHKKSRAKSHARGLAHGFGQALSPLANAVTMYYGSLLVSEGEVTYSNLLKIMQGVIISAVSMGQAVAFTADYEKARLAAIRIFKLLDVKPTIDAFATYGLVKPTIEGSVAFESVRFSYPSRRGVRVLRGLDAEIEPGKTVALVGSSGCGKSTCIQLLERFYDVNKGRVVIDSDDVRDLNVAAHRSHLSLVSQEPVLFDRSIAENIAYGDNMRNPDMTEIIAVARQANIHNFITSLPQGYDTPVGDKGTQLSGGQKQRIAIARALIRNPRILLLDEATSALDTESEKVVQEALDLARTGRTCLVIAHRLTTVQNADLILVLHKGRIVEKGTHQELISKKGFYYGLHNTQDRIEQ